MGYILSMHPDRSAAHDILQETNLVIWEKIDHFLPGTNFKSWAFRIAYLQTLSHLRRQRTRKDATFSQSLLENMSVDAEQVLGDFETRQSALRECLEKLGDRDAEILQAYYFDRRTIAQISHSLDRSAGALKQVLMRLRQTLRACVEQKLAKGFRHA